MAEVTETNPKGAGAPENNTNSNKNNRLWANTIRRVLVQDDAAGNKIRAIAEKLIEKSLEGDMTAIKELGDRIDGKALQTLEAEIDLQAKHEHTHGFTESAQALLAKIK